MKQINNNLENWSAPDWKELLKVCFDYQRIIHLFLPLDIDMQALETIGDEKIMDYLTNKTDGMLQDTMVNYPGKLKMAKKEVGEYQEWQDNKLLNELLGEKISGFLNLLEEKKKAVINDRPLYQSEKEEIIQYFSKDKGWKVEGAKPEVITTFHDWYCALAECLRGKTGE